MFASFCVFFLLVFPVTTYYFIGTRSPNGIKSDRSYSYKEHHASYITQDRKHVNQDRKHSFHAFSNYYYDRNHNDYDLYPDRNVRLRSEIEQFHNHFRKQVIPTASNMLYMYWNEDAAKQAQKYAEVCKFVEHNSWKDRILHNYGSCGQNLFGSQVKTDWYTAIESWFSEYVNFTYGSPHNVFPEVGHYTQMVWATSHQVGCGVAFCRGGPWKQFYNYVCHYCPSGNYDTQFPYKIGQRCGDCPFDCVYGSLCTNYCPSLDGLGNCEELLVEPDICYTGDCNATCWCNDRIHKNYPWV